MLLLHFAIRGLMHEAALMGDEDPDRLSFLHAVRVVRRKLPIFGALPPLSTGPRCMTRSWPKSSGSARRRAPTAATSAASNAR